MVGKSFFVTLCVLIGLGFVSTSEGKPQPLRSDYAYYHQAGGWLKLHLTPATWKNARRECIREGAVLASPEHEDLEEAIFSVLHEFRQRRFTIFTGIHDTYANGHYYSVEGAPLSRMPVRWASDVEKNNTRPNDCLRLSMPEGEVAHGACDDELPFICFMRRTPAAACRMTDKDYNFDKRTKRCYKFHMDKQTWSNAFATCSTEGGHLAVINSDTEAQVLRELYAKAKAKSPKMEPVVFVGFTDMGDHDLWVTIHEQTVKEAGYDKWGPGQPTRQASRCGAMYGNDGKLDDYFCTALKSYICEMDPEKLFFGDTLVDGQQV